MTKPKHIRSRPYYVPEEEREGLLHLLRQGLAAREINRRTGRAVGTILSIATEAGLHTPRTIHRVTGKESATIVRMYAEGKGGEAIEKRLGIGAHTVRMVLKRKGVARRGPQEMHARPYPLWEEAFDVLTPESAYWIGFLMADGNVQHRDFRLFLSLAEKDIDHVRKFRRFMRSTHPIEVRNNTASFSGKYKPRRPLDTYRQARYFFYSKKVVESLAQWGVVPRKSLVAVACGGADQSRDFWRGLVDGDGTVRWTIVGGRRYPTLALVGSHAIVRQFAAWVEQQLGFRPHVAVRGNISAVNLGCQKAKQVAALLYGGATAYLDRKKVVADSFESYHPRGSAQEGKEMQA